MTISLYRKRINFFNSLVQSLTQVHAKYGLQQATMEKFISENEKDPEVAAQLQRLQVRRLGFEDVVAKACGVKV